MRTIVRFPEIANCPLVSAGCGSDCMLHHRAEGLCMALRCGKEDIGEAIIIASLRGYVRYVYLNCP